MTVSEAQQFFGTLALGEQDAAIADKVLREIVQAAAASWRTSASTT